VDITSEILMMQFEALKIRKVVSRKGAKLARKKAPDGLCELGAFA